MAITLDEINQTLLEQNKSLDITARSLVKFIEGEKGRRGDELEEKLAKITQFYLSHCVACCNSFLLVS